MSRKPWIMDDGDFSLLELRLLAHQLLGVSTPHHMTGRAMTGRTMTGGTMDTSAPSYVIGVGPDNVGPTVDGFYDPLLFAMIMTKAIGGQVVFDLRGPTVGGKRVAWKEALDLAVAASPGSFTRLAGGSYVARLAVGSIYEKPGST